MKRRDFIKLSSTASAGLLLPLDLMGMFKGNHLLSTCANNSTKKLVLIQLQGANDGLNTIIPLNQYDLYKGLRPNIAILKRDCLNLDDTLNINNKVGLHPALGNFKSLYENDMMRIIQGVGYPQQNKSHFKSTDLWFTGGDGTAINSNLEDGWIGRFLEKNYTNEIDLDYPLGIQLGSSDNCLGFHSKEHQGFSMNLNNQDLSGYYSIINGLSGEPPKDIPSSEYGDLLRYIIENDKKTNIYAEKVSKCFNAGKNNVTYPDTSIANQLKTVAKLISGGSNTKVYLVKLSGFDTHNNQVVLGKTGTGTHAELLSQISEGIKAFFDDINNQGLGDDVMAVTFSEFGRKIAENGSLGSDHGEVAPMFIFGKSVKSGISGENINLSEAVLENNFQVKTIQYDYRRVFATIIQDWMGSNSETVDYAFFDKNNINSKFSKKKLVDVVNVKVDEACYNLPYVAKITIDNKVLPVSYNFGLLQKDFKFSKDITINNIGTSNLILSDLTISFGYSLDTSKFINTTILPGKSAIYTILVETNSVGEKSGNIKFKTTDPSNQEVNIKLNHEVFEIITSPNPFFNSININGIKPVDMKRIELYDNSQRVIRTWRGPFRTGTINTSGINSGTYFLVITTDYGSFSTKVLRR